MLITIEGSTATATLQGAITVKAAGAHIAALDNTATINPDWDNIEVTGATFIRTINGVSPDSNGAFFLSGSECDSWGYITGGTAVDAGYKDGDGLLAADPVVAGSTASGIWLTDLCPACDSCEMLYRLKQEVIQMKLWLAVLRDVSLYQAGNELKEANWLWDRKFPAEPNCGAYVLGSTFSAYAKDEGYSKGLQLIQQYMTTVHMWNYLVNRNNKSDVISIAPEDTSGFVVQTKRSVTSCSSKQKISCRVSILSCNAVADNGEIETVTEQDSKIPVELVNSHWFQNDGIKPEYPVSMLIPRAEVKFTPFQKQDDSAYPVGIPGTTIGVVIEGHTYGGAQYNMIISNADSDAEYKTNAELPETPVYCRYAETGELPVIAAGTYEVQVKFLPFVNSIMLDEEDNPISLRGTKSETVTGSTEGDAIVFHFFKEDTAPTYLVNPITDQYINAKTAPTVSVLYKLMWTIEIKWLITDDTSGESLETQTYKYVCNGIRQYYSSSVIDGSTLSLAGLPEDN